MVWVEPAVGGAGERVRVRSDAALAVAGYLGGPWRFLAALGRLIPAAFRDAVYDRVAAWRHRLARTAPSCPLVDAAERDRFLDL